MTLDAKSAQALQVLMGEFDGIDRYLKAAGEILAGGHMPDLAGLDDRITYLCTAIQNAPPEIQQRCLPRFDELLRKLDICENDVRLFHGDAVREGRS